MRRRHLVVIVTIVAAIVLCILRSFTLLQKDDKTSLSSFSPPNSTASTPDWTGIGGIRRLKEQAVKAGPGLVCYPHTTDNERAMYRTAEGFYRCLVQSLCVVLKEGRVERFVIPVSSTVPDPSAVTINSLFGKQDIWFQHTRFLKGAFSL